MHRTGGTQQWSPCGRLWGSGEWAPPSSSLVCQPCFPHAKLLRQPLTLRVLAWTAASAQLVRQRWTLSVEGVRSETYQISA